MSGPLASWVGKHSEGGWRAVLVVKELALDCRPDGRPFRPVTRDQLCTRTRVHMTTIREGLREARELGQAGKRGGVVVLQQGGGRGWASLYRVLVEQDRLCAVEADCRECNELRSVLRPDRPEETGRQAPRSRKRMAANRAPRNTNRARGGRKRAPGAPQTETGDGSPPSGGTVTHPESAASPAPSHSSGSAAEPGMSSPKLTESMRLAKLAATTRPSEARAAPQAQPPEGKAALSEQTKREIEAAKAELRKGGVATALQQHERRLGAVLGDAP